MARRIARLTQLSLRDRLTAMLITISICALAISGTFAIALLRGQLFQKIDNQLLTTAEVMVREPSDRRQPAPPRGVPTSTYGAEVFDSGLTRYLGRRFTTDSPNLELITPQIAAAQNGQPFTVAGADNKTRWRVVAIRLQNPILGPGTVVIGLNLADTQDTITKLTLMLFVISLGVIAAVGVAGWLMVRRALRPLREVETIAGAIARGDLSKRVPDHPQSTEVGRLSGSLNAMLSQIEQSFAVRAASEFRMRRFVSDASHELRTPLAAVRGYAELYRQGAVREPDDVAGAMRRIETEATRMGVLVEDLLTLARLDEQRPQKFQPVDLTVLAADAVQDARALDQTRSITLTGLGSAISPTTVLGDESKLRQVISNLVANALRHTPTGTPIELAVGLVARLGTGVIQVRDHGPGIPQEQGQQVFERFFRADESRQRASGGTGLGLAIVAAIVTGHGGTVDHSPTEGGGATFTVRLPLTETTEDPPEVPEDPAHPAD